MDIGDIFALLPQQIVFGLALGAVYALLAVGYTMVYGVLFMINFAHGDVLMIGSMAGWAILSGIVQVAAAVRFRRVIRGELFLGLAGAVAILFGLLLVARPGAGLVALAFLLGWFAIFYGIVLIALGLRLRRLLRELQDRVAVPIR